MAKVNYQAIEHVDGSHAAGTNYDLSFAVEVLNENSTFIQNTPRSLNGAEEVVFIREDNMWDIKASYIPKTSLVFWKEFIYSVKLGQSFTWYPDDASSYIVTLQTKGYKPIRFGTTDDDFSFSLKFKEFV